MDELDWKLLCVSTRLLFEKLAEEEAAMKVAARIDAIEVKNKEAIDRTMRIASIKMAIRDSYL